MYKESKDKFDFCCRLGGQREPRGDHLAGGVDHQEQGHRERGGAQAGRGGGYQTDAGRTGREKDGASHLHLQTGMLARHESNVLANGR